MKKFKIAVLNTHPIQYFAPLYAYLNQSPELEVTAVYLSDASVRGAMDKGFGKTVKWDVDLLKNYPHKFVGKALNRELPTGKFFSLYEPAAVRELVGGGYDAVWIHGHGYITHVLTILAARIAGIPILMRCETHTKLARTGWKKRAQRPLLRALYGLCSRYLAIGSDNAAFYKWLGLAEKNIFLVPYAVDNNRYGELSKLSRTDRLQARKALGINDQLPVILFASKFQTKKRPEDLATACAQLWEEGIDFHLVLAGSGELEGKLRAMLLPKYDQYTHFPGFVNQGDLPKLYGSADVFVLPSDYEPWGLVVNEAMCCGLPIVASDAVAAGTDLVRNGENGFRFKTGDIEDLKNALKPLLLDGGLRKKMSAKSKEIMSNWSFEDSREGLLKAISGLRKAS